MVSKNTRDQSFETKSKTKTGNAKTKTKTKTAKKRSRDQDRGLEDYITVSNCDKVNAILSATPQRAFRRVDILGMMVVALNMA